MTINDKPQVPAWALQAPRVSQVVYEGIPRQYRFDGEVGRFFVGEKDCGSTLVVQLFDHRTVEAERFGRPVQTWLDLAFVDLAQVVGVLALKKEGAINLAEFLLSELRQTASASIDPVAVRVTLTAEHREGDDGPYYVVVVSDWAFVDEGQFWLVKNWHQQADFHWLFLGEG